MPTSTARSLHTVLGSGPAGTAVATELARRGHAVRLVDRKGEGPAYEGVERRAADVSTLEGALAAIEGAAVVYHAVNVGYHLQVEVMPRIQEAVLGAVEATGARLVVLDTLYPYGETHGEVMTEETPWRATSRKGRMRAELDERYLAAHREGRARVVLARSADFVGPGVFNSSLGGAFFPAALTGGEALGLGDIDLAHSYTYIGDLAVGLAALGERPEGDGRVWHLPTAPAVSTREVHRLVEERLGQPLKVLVLDVLRPVGPFDEAFVGEYAEMFYQHTEPQIMDSSAFESTFGIRPTPLGEALDATIAFYRDVLSGPAGQR
ncbi:NAD-dependent epimerase/dehydratase family protein [Streptomyces sp. NPDC058691]|uniref:NAD-dependent epimerase/dehydratase family protein n=1 Tax=Streptomyces sp. NPDC058691 TaxID=3346601 RepID=UPI00365062D0